MMSLDDDDWAKNESCSCKHELGHHIHIRTRSKDDWAAVSFTVDPCTRCSCSFFQPVDNNNDKLREIVENLRRPLAERDLPNMPDPDNKEKRKIYVVGSPEHQEYLRTHPDAMAKYQKE